MAGLIDVSILKPGLAGATYREAEQAKQQTELNQIKLEQLKQDAIALKDLQVKMRAAGQSDDPNVFFRALIQTGKPEYMEKGYEGLRRYDELRRNESMLRSLEPDLFAKPGAAPTAAPTAGAGAGAPTVGAGAATAAAPTAAAPAAGAGAQAATNALAPMTAETPDINALRRRLTALSLINDPRAKAMAKVVEGQINELSKSITVAPGGTVIQGGKPIYTAPAAPAPLARLMALRDSLPMGSADRLAIEAQINKEIAGNRTFDPNTGLLVDKVTGQFVTPGATPAGQPGAAPLVPGIAPAGQPVVTPTARPPLDMMQSPAFQDLVRRGVVSTPQEAAALAQAMSLDAAGKPVNITVPNALAGAAPSVNAMAGAPTGVAPSGLNPVQANIAFREQQQALNEPVQVIDPASGNTVYVSKSEAIRRGMTPAEKSTDLTSKQIQQLEFKFPQATNAVKTFESKAESLEKDLKRLAEHPGLSGISGGIFGISGRTPALTKDARAAEARYNSIIARGGFNELQSLRSASPAGGALGNVSNQENQYLRDAFAPIKLTQDTADLKKALLDAANSVAGSRQRIRETYDLTYEYRKNRGGAAPAPAAAGAASVTLPDGRTMNFPDAAAAAAFKKAAGL